MTLSSPKKYYSRFLEGHKGKLHFASHSHHFWPDVTREAQLAYWDDTAKTSDEKWDKIFGEVIPTFQSHVARILNLKDPQQIAFAPNTHELTARLLSLFLGKKELNILTTESEFHSWKRQMLRLKELPEFHLETVSTATILSYRRSFIEELKTKLQKKPDLFFISQVFFDSGIALTVDELIELEQSKHQNTIMVVDGYHGFAAIPTDLGSLEGKIFYLAGGYKYAQAGEGACFLVIPKGNWRPAYTGWFAEFAELSRPAGTEVGYSQDFMAFMGSTQDSSGLYRFNAAWDLFQKEGITVEQIHQHVLKMQQLLINVMPETFLDTFELTPLFERSLYSHGHFLTFISKSEKQASEAQEMLKNEGILIDRRGNRLRFGLGLYQDQADVEELGQCLQKLAKKSP